LGRAEGGQKEGGHKAGELVGPWCGGQKMRDGRGEVRWMGHASGRRARQAATE